MTQIEQLPACSWKLEKWLLFWSLFCVAWRQVGGQGGGADSRTCWQSYIFPCEESTSSTESSAYVVMGQIRAGLESSWERLSGVLLWECWLGLSFSPQLLSAVWLSARRCIWPHVCCLYCSRWQYLVLNRIPRNITNFKGEKVRSMCHSPISIFPNRILSKCLKVPLRKHQDI